MSRVSRKMGCSAKNLGLLFTFQEPPEVANTVAILCIEGPEQSEVHLDKAKMPAYLTSGPYLARSAILMPRWLRGIMSRLTNTIIEAAIFGFEAQKKSIDAQIAELRAMITGASEAVTQETPAKGARKHFSAAARKRMQQAQKLRWAKIRSEAAQNGKPANATKPKRTISAAGRKAIAAAQRKRWAAKKSASA